jgi:hypothetical protein
MTTDEAKAKGYTVEYYAEAYDGSQAITGYCKPDVDFDGVVVIYYEDDQKFIRLNGWNWDFEAIEEGE